MLFFILFFAVCPAYLFVEIESNMICFLPRLAKFLNLKKEASSFAGRIIEPVLRLLNENGLVAVWYTLFILKA